MSPSAWNQTRDAEIFPSATVTLGFTSYSSVLCSQVLISNWVMLGRVVISVADELSVSLLAGHKQRWELL